MRIPVRVVLIVLDLFMIVYSIRFTPSSHALIISASFGTSWFCCCGPLISWFAWSTYRPRTIWTSSPWSWEICTLVTCLANLKYGLLGAMVARLASIAKCYQKVAGSSPAVVTNIGRSTSFFTKSLDEEGREMNLCGE